MSGATRQLQAILDGQIGKVTFVQYRLTAHPFFLMSQLVREAK